MRRKVIGKYGIPKMLRHQVWENGEYHLAFDTEKQAKKYVKSMPNKKLKIKKYWLD